MSMVFKNMAKMLTQGQLPACTTDDNSHFNNFNSLNGDHSPDSLFRSQ